MTVMPVMYMYEMYCIFICNTKMQLDEEGKLPLFKLAQFTAAMSILRYIEDNENQPYSILQVPQISTDK